MRNIYFDRVKDREKEKKREREREKATEYSPTNSNVTKPSQMTGRPAAGSSKVGVAGVSEKISSSLFVLHSRRSGRSLKNLLHRSHSCQRFSYRQA